MKNLILILVLSGSVIGNVWLVSRLAEPEKKSAPATGSYVASTHPQGTTGAASKKSAAATPAKPQAITWSTPGTSNDDLRGLAAKLRSAGFPPRVVAAIVTTYLQDREFADNARLPFWQLANPGKETRALQTAAAQSLLKQQEEVLGVDGTPGALMDPTIRAHRYGNLSDEKVDALLKIQRDYSELSNTLNNGQSMYSFEEARARETQRAALEKEKLADMAATLTPEEMSAYELRSSSTANRVMNGLREVTVSEQEYAAIYQLQKNFESKSDSPAGFTPATPEGLAKTQAARYELNEQLRLVLPEDRFYTYLASSDPIYGEVARFAETQSNLDHAKSYALYQLQNEANATLQVFAQRLRLARESSSSTHTITQERIATQATFAGRLETLLGAEAAAAYRKEGNGRVFTPPNQLAAPTTPTPPKG